MPTLAEIIAAEADVVSAFVLLLLEEQEALKEGNADALPGIIDRKWRSRELPPLPCPQRDTYACGSGTDRTALMPAAKQPADKAVRQNWTSCSRGGRSQGIEPAERRTHSPAHAAQRSGTRSPLPTPAVDYSADGQAAAVPAPHH
jgi:hypothetical protein